MPKIKYQTIDFRKSSLDVIEQANDIIDAYRAQGYDLTLRQLYYQFVSRDLLPNTQKSYDRLGSIVNDARLAGLIDWNAITDRTRNIRSVGHWGNPASIIQSAAEGFRLDKWANQPNRCEVWIEKDALVGVFERVMESHDVGLFSCRGYVSQSEMWAAARRMRAYELGGFDRKTRSITQGQKTTILHFGDHDPSGIDMTRDIQDRLQMFGARTEVKRIALNMDQVEQYNPPPNPAKVSDSRFDGYSAIHGDESWELDALEPSVLSDLARMEIEALRDDDLWKAMVEKEQDHRNTLLTMSANYDDVAAHVADSYDLVREDD